MTQCLSNVRSRGEVNKEIRLCTDLLEFGMWQPCSYTALHLSWETAQTFVFSQCIYLEKYSFPEKNLALKSLTEIMQFQ